jgi:hypothetical protein
MMNVHPLEQLRYIARRWEIDDEFPAQEAAAILADLASENPASLLQACRRLIDYFPSAGVAWWLCARALGSPEPIEGIWEAADELSSDPTPGMCAKAVPAQATVAFPDPLPRAVRALRKRKDLQLVDRPTKKADLVLLRVRAAGPDGVRVSRRSGSSRHNGRRPDIPVWPDVPVWAVLERGALLPGPLWEQLLARSANDEQTEVVPLDELGSVVTDHGPVTPADAVSKPTCPPVAELLGWRS